MSLQDRQTAAGLSIPKPDSSVRRRGNNSRSVGRKGRLVHIVFVTSQDRPLARIDTGFEQGSKRLHVCWPISVLGDHFERQGEGRAKISSRVQPMDGLRHV